MPWSQHLASWLWAPPLPLSALQFIPVYMLKLAAAECVSELDERRHEWMEAWVDGGVDRRACVAVAWLLHTTSLQTAHLWHRFLLFVPFTDSLNIY